MGWASVSGCTVHHLGVSGFNLYLSLFVISLLITITMIWLWFLLYFISIIKLLLPQPTYLSHDSPPHPTGVEGWGNEQAAVWY